MAERSSAREERHLNLGGRLVNIVIEPGPGRPVVMLGGCGVPSYAWDPVTKRLPDRLRVRLDRPGLAGTPWPDRLPTLEEEIATLVELTTRFPGGVLVAHSMASFHAEGVIRTRPDLVAGLVLVDGSVETVARSPVGDGAWLAAARVAEWAADIGALAALGPLVDRLTVTAQSRRRLLDRMDPRSWDTYADADAVASVIAESAAYRRQAQDLVRVRVAHRWPIGLPVEVLTAAAAGGQRSVTVQGKLARLLGGRQTVLTESRHIVMIDDPQAIADAVERVLGAVETEQVLGSEPAAETK